MLIFYGGSMSEQLFIQIKKYTHTSEEHLTVKDVASVLCSNEHITNKVNCLTIYKFHGNKNKRVVLSSLYIINQIQSEISPVEIVPLGSTDIVAKYEPHPKHNKFIEFIKVLFICITTFFGSAFSIIAFNTDIDLNKVFNTLHNKLNVKDTTNFVILELTYSFGIALGIMLFYNHFGNKKLSTDPTPLEIEMRLYEDDINNSIIDGDNRKEDV